MIDKLGADVVEEGKNHPFVQALRVELAHRHRQCAKLLEAKSAAGEGHAVLAGLGGRAAELRSVMELIARTEGIDE